MITKFIVNPRVPERLRPALTIARNLRWVWQRDAVALFNRIDSDLWEECGHNPIALLCRVRPERLEDLARDDPFLAHLHRVESELGAYLDRKTWYTRCYGDTLDINIAYFTMEVGLHETLPFYSGGLGALSGDHLKSADELGLPFVGISLCYQEGYYRQYLNLDGWQQERYPENDLYNMPIRLVRDPQGRDVTVEVELPDRVVVVRIWQVLIGSVRLFLLDTNIPENAQHDRAITARLYGGDRDMRMRQEIVLGIGGMRALDKLGFQATIHHMNEGHSAFLALEKIRVFMKHGLSFEEAKIACQAGTVFTTHTPVPAGNERFAPDLLRTYFKDYVKDLDLSLDDLVALGREDASNAREDFCMTVLALRLCAHSNGVSKLHGEISRRMWKRVWPGVPEREIPIAHITNGIHIRSWLSDDFSRLYERYLGPRIFEDPVNQQIWERVERIPDSELWRAKERLRERLVSYVRKSIRKQTQRFGAHHRKMARAEEILDPEVLTIGFARRFATYKRATLILHDLPRLRRLLLDHRRPVQLIFAGKAHPHDHPGKEMIRAVARLADDEELHSRVAFIEDYDIGVARHLVQGVDVWLNTPRRPMEASGTSGMKVPINGGLNLSILDGWWCEGYEGDNGWAIGAGEEYTDDEAMDQTESTILYELLEKEIVPLFYDRGPDGLPREWIQFMKNSMRSISPVFSTNRMVQEYTEKTYVPAAVQCSLLFNNNFESTRLIASWKKHVSEAWHEVVPLDVVTDTSKELELGDKLPVSVTVQLGKLSPQEVSVEILYGSLDVGGQIDRGESFALDFKSAEDTVATFSGDIPCAEPGRNGFAVRVLPYRREILNKFQLGKITWWAGGHGSPKNVAEKVLGAVN